MPRKARKPKVRNLNLKVTSVSEERWRKEEISLRLQWKRECVRHLAALLKHHGDNPPDEYMAEAVKKWRHKLFNTTYVVRRFW